MTKDELAKLSLDERRVLIAELCGWTDIREADTFDPLMNVTQYWEGKNVGEAHAERLPDFYHDLNAIHEVTEHWTRNEGNWFWDVFRTHLERINEAEFWNASAAQRSDAFLLTVDVPMSQNSELSSPRADE